MVTKHLQMQKKDDKNVPKCTRNSNCTIPSCTDIMINETRNQLYKDHIKLTFYFAHTIY